MVEKPHSAKGKEVRGQEEQTGEQPANDEVETAQDIMAR
jgi:hypothetical protein